MFSTIATRARLGFLACALLGLTGCGAPLPFFGATGGDETSGGPVPSIGATRLVERDVEAPEVFEVTEDGLWDGRPSLGGVWVAHPTATDPERVIIRNDENGRFVIGALFRRERDTPGPALMVSSDAAAALNVLAGRPTQLQVTALRREDVPYPAAETPLPPEAEEPAITATALADPIAAAQAAIAESEAAEAQPPTPPAAPQATQTALARPFVQIGIFSVQENANNTAQALRTAGLAPTLYDQTSNGRRFWRVVVGPLQTEADREAALQTVRRLGFQDAYFVAR